MLCAPVFATGYTDAFVNAEFAFERQSDDVARPIAERMRKRRDFWPNKCKNHKSSTNLMYRDD
jgi:hypothetical protein